jgi:hypothetical protein
MNGDSFPHQPIYASHALCTNQLSPGGVSVWIWAGHYMHCNFGRVHPTLRVTPAMEAGVADHIWTIQEIVGLIDARWERSAA